MSSAVLRSSHIRTGFFSVLGTVVMLAGSGAPLSAQGLDPREETRLLRTAANLEADGDFVEAEELLRDIVRRNPDSAAALFSLERVLRSQARLEEMLPVVDSILVSDPGISRAHSLRMRVMVEVGRTDELRGAADAWIASNPQAEEPYRESAQIVEEPLGPEAALELLQAGRTALGRSDALALEMGDALYEAGRESDAVREWGVAMGDGGADFTSVIRRLEALGDRAPVEAVPLIENLVQEPTTDRRMRAAARVAVSVGLEERSIELAEAVSEGLSAGERRGFVSGFARWAEESRANRAALWAYQEMRGLARDAGEARLMDQRVATMALAAGDTTAALEAQQRIADALPRGSVERRRGLANLLAMQASALSPEELAGHIEAFNEEFPGADEVDELYAGLAERLLARGEMTAARDLLAESHGPQTELTRAYIFLAEGEVEEGRDALTAAAANLPPSEATGVIYLANILTQLDSPAAEVAAEAIVLARAGRSAIALNRIEVGSPDADEADRPALLSLAARIADEATLYDRGAEFRETILGQHRDSPEAPGAALALARYQADQPDGLASAIAVLEELILSRPNSPVVPDARRELQKLQRRGGGR